MRYAVWLVGAASTFAAVAPTVHAQGFGRHPAPRVVVAPRPAPVRVYHGGAAVGPFGGVHVAPVVRPVPVPRIAAVPAVRAPVAVVGPAGGVHVAPVRPELRTYGYHGPIALGHATHYWGPAYLGSQAAYIRRSFVRPVYTPDWYRLHTGAWVARRWRVPNFWVAPVWPALALYCGINDPPIYYDYGASLVINNNNVYWNGEEIATADQYATQAIAYSDAGRLANPDPNEEWQPLGVFGLIQGQEQQAQQTFQLAVDRAGIVRGNYYDANVDNTLPVYGSVDPRTQRIAWSVGDKKTVVFETGLNNLLQPQTAVLVHHGTEQTVQMMLIRLDQPPPQ